MDILKEVRTAGQSLWLDNLSRDLLVHGVLAGMKRNFGISGITSNPSIFEQAILKSASYTEALANLAARDAAPEEIFETLALEDIRRAADLFLDVYDMTGGTDGYVSMEVKPSLAYDTENTVKEGVRLFEALGRRNVLIKVPATPQGLRAGNALLRKGVNVNFTLIFSPDRYGEVISAYLDALSWRVRNQLPVTALASVASFFVSRIDTAVDAEIQTLLKTPEAFDNEDLYDFANSAKGRAGIANSLIAYKKYSAAFSGGEFRALQRKGAMKQRILWASTGVKNPAYKDTLYADALLLPDSVNTLPEAALKAFVEHGAPDRAPLAPRIAAAEGFFTSLELAGVNFKSILGFLETDGVEKFSRAYDSLLLNIDEKNKLYGRGALAGGKERY